MNRRSLLRFTGLLLELLAASGPASAQDPRHQPPPPRPAATSAWRASLTQDGYTVWRKENNSGCSSSDHNYQLDMPKAPELLSDISYSMSNFDVDYNSSGCNGNPEVDLMYFNGNLLGLLTGADGSWSINTWPLNKSQVVSGANAIRIDTDAPNTGWQVRGRGLGGAVLDSDVVWYFWTAPNLAENDAFAYGVGFALHAHPGALPRPGARGLPDGPQCQDGRREAATYLGVGNCP